jgi:hypothetical protein
MRDADEKRKMRRMKEKKKKSLSSSTRPHGLISRPAASYLNQSWELSLMELSDSLLPAAVTVTVKMEAKCGARRSLGQGANLREAATAPAPARTYSRLPTFASHFLCSQSLERRV